MTIDRETRLVRALELAYDAAHAEVQASVQVLVDNDNMPLRLAQARLDVLSEVFAAALVGEEPELPPGSEACAMTTALTCSCSTSAHHWWGDVEAVRIGHASTGYVQRCLDCGLVRITWWAPGTVGRLVAYSDDRGESVEING